MKRHINIPGFGRLHIAAFIPVAMFGMAIVGGVAFTIVDMALHPPTPEERAKWKAEREAEKAEEEKAKQAKAKADREKLGYIDDPAVHKTAQDVITSAGFSCPGVHGVRAMGDAGRGNVLRVQCTNNVFFAVTLLPDGSGASVKIDD